jgi:hypothetical protein
MLRGRALWVCAAIAMLPVVYAIVMQSHGRSRIDEAFVIELLVLGVLPPAFVAASIGEEIEDRTTTYLWSRPLARWTMPIGKLIGLAPVVVVLVVASWGAAIEILTRHAPPTDSVIALAATSIAVSMVSAGIATLVPKHGMALTIVYMLFFNVPIGEIPASIQIASLTHQAQLIARLDASAPASTGAIAMTIVAVLWLAVGVWRVQRMES